MKRNEISQRAGFTLLELVIVVAIISVMAGVAVPYYQDYITDARINANKSNMANFRRVLEDFKGDHGRGPYRGIVYSKGVTYDCTFSSNNHNELVMGVVPPVSAAYTDRRHKYINSLPVLEDPITGERLTLQAEASASIYFIDSVADPHPGAANGNGFDLDNDPWYKQLNPASFSYSSASCDIGSGTAAMFGAAGATFPADIVTVYATDSTGVRY